MSKLIELAERLDEVRPHITWLGKPDDLLLRDVVTALREVALAKPVAYRYFYDHYAGFEVFSFEPRWNGQEPKRAQPLYAAPPAPDVEAIMLQADEYARQAALHGMAVGCDSDTDRERAAMENAARDRLLALLEGKNGAR